MSVHLLDINVLVALLWTNHEHHAEAAEWFRLNNKAGWATTPMTQAGFVRISSNPRIFPDAPSPAKASEILQANLSHPTHRFWKDELSFAEAVAVFADRLTGHQQCMDAYLLGTAIHRRGVLVTLDTRMKGLLEEKSVHLKALKLLG